MTLYTTNWGEETFDKDEVIEKTLAHMDEDDLVRILLHTLDSEKVLHWALHEATFLEEFQDEIVHARDVWLDDQGWWEEEY